MIMAYQPRDHGLGPWAN